jgi:FKBP-type peptidyl-prolyl cis-trans isomerase FkpA/FKBP-type peptidyl-prolyl cis-trans isomerase FklB
MRLKDLGLLVVVSLACGACSAQTPPAPAPGSAPPGAPGADADTLYAMGLVISSQVSSLRLTEAELKSIVEGLTDGALHRPRRVEPETQMPRINEWVQARQMAAATAEKEAGAAYIEKAVADEGARRLPSGLAIKTVAEGSGATPTLEDNVSAHYTGMTIDGAVFDSSVQRGQPGTFGLKAVIPCWSEALQQIKVGGKARVYCPSNLAYGDRGRPPKIVPGATLVFDVELLEIQPRPAPASTPAP